MFAGGADLATAIEQVARIGAPLLLLQTAIEAESTVSRICAEIATEMATWQQRPR